MGNKVPPELETCVFDGRKRGLDASPGIAIGPDFGPRYPDKWVYDCIRRGPGKKLLLVDEVWQWQDGLSLPRELALVVQTGREENLELVCATQLPHKVNAAITGQSTELVCFRLGEEKALDRIGELEADRAAVQALPLGSFISYNRLSGASLTGKVF